MILCNSKQEKDVSEVSLERSKMYFIRSEKYTEELLSVIEDLHIKQVTHSLTAVQVEAVV